MPGLVMLSHVQCSFLSRGCARNSMIIELCLCIFTCNSKEGYHLMRNCNNLDNPSNDRVSSTILLTPRYRPLQDVTIRAYGDNHCMFNVGSWTKSSTTVRETDCLVPYAQFCNFLTFVTSWFCCSWIMSAVMLMHMSAGALQCVFMYQFI